MDNFNIERVERQNVLNTKMKDLGNIKFDKNELRMAKVGGYGETKGGIKASDQAVAGFIIAFDEYSLRHITTKGKVPTLVKKLVEKSTEEEMSYKVNPSVIARITLKGVMSSLVRPEDKRINITTVATLIGRDLEYALKSAILDLHYAEEKEKAMEMLRRQGLLGDPDEIRKVMEKLANSLETGHEEWTNHETIEVGQALLLLLAKAQVHVRLEGYGDEKQELTFGDFFIEDIETVHNFATGKPKSRKTFKISEQGVAWLLENEDFMKGLAFSYLPMVIPPMDWTFEEGHGFKGGYYEQSLFSRYPLMKSVPSKTLNKLYEDKPEGFETLMDAINKAQQTPFRINETVFRAVEWVDKEQIQLDRKGVPAYTDGWVEMFGSKEKADEFFELKKQLELNDDNSYTESSRKILDDFILSVVAGSEMMTIKEARSAFKSLREDAKNFNRAEKSKRLLITNIVQEASQFLDEDIYFCYNADFRGRIYPIAGQFQPQGSDTSKGMLEFAKGEKAESQDTLDYIAYQIANSWGADKLPIKGRVKWTHEHTEKILECAYDFVESQWWMEADKPFLFLLGCIEWLKVKTAEMSGDPLGFETTLPIAFDGSCNGIQHFSAMLRDEDGATHVNLIPSEAPADVYQVVASAALVEVKGLNRKWAKFIVDLNVQLDNGLFNRKVSKRATMTLPYGVSESSAGDYVLEEVDKFIRSIPMLPSGRKEVRKLMKKLIWNSILANVGSPVEAKDYLQNIANAMTEERAGLKWYTPTGLPILQKVMAKEAKLKRVKLTVNGHSIDRRYPVNSMKINSKEQANGIAPNFVHSFDSAHLQKTVIAASKEGVKDFLLIHDSFAVNANKAKRFNHIIREQFVGIYHGKDYLKEFQDECESQLGGEMLYNVETGAPILPLRLGSFDVRRVLGSVYFFS